MILDKDKILALKNDEMREQKIRAYREWEFWIEVKEVEITFYRLQVDTFGTLICEERPHTKEWMPYFSHENTEYCTTKYYWIKTGAQKRFADCEVSKTEIVKLLKEITKKIRKGGANA